MEEEFVDIEIESGTENGTIDPFEVTIISPGGENYEYVRRYTTLNDPQDAGDIAARRLYVTEFEIIGGLVDGSNLFNFGGVGVGSMRLEVYGSAYISNDLYAGRAFIGGFNYTPEGGGLCPIDIDDLRLYVNGDTVIERNTIIEQDLVVRGDCCIEGTLTKGGGTFDIVHPLEEEKRLRHSFVEGPRYDNIYRNKVRLTKGKAIVNLDTDCVSPGGQTMTPGTWEKLNRNPDIFLQNLEGWSRLKGKITGSTLEIKCEDENCMDLVSWMVVAERQDNFIKNCDISDGEGRLILEYEY
jgi:hypothetical protein